MKKRVLLVSHNLNFEGAPRMLLILAKTLKKAGYDLELLSFYDGPLRTNFEKLRIKVSVSEDDVDRFLLNQTEWFKNFDAIIANTVLSYPVIKYFANILPVIWYIHEAENLIEICQDIPELPFCLKNSSNIVAVSEHCKWVLEKYFNITNVNVISNVIDSKIVNNPIDKVRPEELIFTYVGSIDRRKALDIILSANLISRSRDKYKIKIAGNILDQAYFHDVIERQLLSNVEFLGVLSNDECNQLIANSSAVVVPSKNESFSLVVFEALRHGVPSIVPNYQWAKDICDEKTAIYFKKDDPVSLSKVFDRFVNDNVNLDLFDKCCQQKFIKKNSIDVYKDKFISIIENVDKHNNVDGFLRCTGCGLCSSLCPNSAIKMKENNEGFLAPFVNNKLCNNCGICKGKCPVINANLENSTNPDCLALAAKDEVRLDKCSSGGIFTTIAQKFIADGGYVCGAVINKDNQIEHIVSNNADDLFRMRGSKYVQSNIVKALQEAKSLLASDKKLLFSGTPCQIAAANTFLKTWRENLFLVDIVCHGVPSPGIFSAYIKETIGNDRVKSINFRSKIEKGWTEPYVNISSEKKQKIEPFDNNPYTSLFNNNCILRKSCESCSFQRLPRQGDITIGDFWGIETTDPSAYDNKGTSVVLINNERGEYLINRNKDNYIINKKQLLASATQENPNIISSTKAHPEREKFFEAWRTGTSVSSINDKIFRGKCDVMLLNYWYSKNYGATLTSFALYKFLENNGFDVRQINYIPDNFYPLFSNSFSERFTKKYMKFSRPCKTWEDFISLNSLADTFITGSDQVFNFDIYSEHGMNIFQLDFTNKNKRRIACSASFGGNSFTAKGFEKDFFNICVSDFNCISVRESDGVKILKDNFGIVSQKICDPVFSLSKNEWGCIAGDEPLCKVKYFASYILAGGHADAKIPWIEKSIENIESNLDYKDLRVSFDKNYDVEDWLNIIMNSEFVVTDSFHAACFSVIFNKPLIFLLNNTKLYSRLDNLFKHFKIKPLVITENDYAEKLQNFRIPSYNFDIANKQLENDSKIFKEWMLEAMNKKVNKVSDLNDIYKKEIGKLKHDNFTLKQDNQVLEQKLQQMTQHANNLQEMYDAVHQSFSWKVTKPYRFISSRFKSIRK